MAKSLTLCSPNLYPKQLFLTYLINFLFFYRNIGKLWTKGQLISKAIYSLLTSPKKTNRGICFVCFLRLTTNKTNSSIRFLGEFTYGSPICFLVLSYLQGHTMKKCVLTKYPRYFTIYSAFLPKSVICLGCFRKKLSHMSIVHVQIHYFCHFVEVSCKDIVALQFTDFFCLHYSTFE